MKSRVFHGLLRPRLFLGCDGRLLFAVALLAVVGVFPHLWIAWPTAVVVFAAARVLGKVSPYAVDELLTYAANVFVAWDGYLPDESALAKPDRKALATWRKVRT